MQTNNKQVTEAVILNIEGMSSSREEGMINRKLSSLAGIRSFDINTKSKQVQILYDPSQATVQDIIRSIPETGMNASVAQTRKKRSTWWREKQQLALYGCGLTTLIGFAAQYLMLAPALVYNGLFVLAVVIGVFFPARKALRALVNMTFTIHLLMLIGAGGAMILGMWSEASILIFVYSLGDVLESFAVDKARGAINSLVALMPKEALVKKDGKEVVMPTEDIVVGDIVVVRPGEKIPVDGTVVHGSSFVDQAAVTGESIPEEKQVGNDVFAGTINQNGSLEVRVDKLADETMLSKVVSSVEEAQAEKTSYQTFAEKFSQYYTPIMFILGILVATIPPLFFGQEWYPFIYRGLVVFVVSCSCGLAISVPVAVVAGMANAARNGTIFKGGSYLEVVDKVKVVAFDKTGTLTIGRPEVTDVKCMNGISEAELLSLAGSIESKSGHPISAAVVRKAKESGNFTDDLMLESFEEKSGFGLQATIDGHKFVISNPRFQQELGVSMKKVEKEVSNLESQGKTVIAMSRDGELIGLLAIADKIRPDTQKSLQQLKKAGIRTVMLTGDNERCAKAIAKMAGVDKYYAGLLPTDKVDTLKKLREEYGSVAMVGDGINDAPAMAVSNVGIAMGAAGSDIAIEAGDIVLMSDDLGKIAYLRGLSRRAITTIKQNIVVSLLNVAFMIIMAVMGYLGLVMGLLLNEMSAVFVIFNALRLLTWRDRNQKALKK